LLVSDRVLRAVYSLRHAQWLRQDSLGWTPDPAGAGTWPQKEALEKMASLPVNTRPILVEPPEGD
jgi:hypothetical protein